MLEFAHFQTIMNDYTTLWSNVFKGFGVVVVTRSSSFTRFIRVRPWFQKWWRLYIAGIAGGANLRI